ncbi:MAG: hypothetical protein IKN04_05275 [Clostridia bacterium]|nr:hypothetical protein [Clostridia bacterium]
MKRRLISWALLCALLLTLAPQALAQAYSYSDDLPQYVVESFEPNGYCYLYDKPSDVNGRNLGKHENGEIVKVISYEQSYGYYFVVCSNGKTGYIHDYALQPYGDTVKRTRYRVYSIDPEGYSYLYDKPSDINGRNLGKYTNGEYIQIVDWDASEDYAAVYSERTKKNGYMHKTALVQEKDYKPLDFYAVVDSTDPYGYCYLYSEPSDIYGMNRGRHDNGEWVRVIDWDIDDVFCLVECPKDNKMGYIRKTCLRRI